MRLVRISIALVGLCALIPATAAGSSTRLSHVRHVHANGISIGYRVGGHGPHLTLITGRSAAMADWSPVMLKALMKDHRVLVFDNRGVATSTNVPDDTMTVTQMANDTAKLIKKLHFGPTDVLAWSMGGYVGQTLAHDHPGRVKQLILNGSNTGDGDHYTEPGKLVQRLLASPYLPPQVLFALCFPPNRDGFRSAARYLRQIYTQSGLVKRSFHLAKATRADQLNAVTGWKQSGSGSWSWLPQLKNRILTADGVSDEIDPAENSQRIAQRAANGRYCSFEDSGHAFMFQYPKPFARLADHFLRGKPVKPFARQSHLIRCG